jgi:cell wall-associated NlpC family hydrolase
MNHWAAHYVGKDWDPRADGPDAFSCWGLVRSFYRTEHGIALPFVAVGQADENNVRAIKQAAQVSGRRRVDRHPRDGDIVVLPLPLEVHAGLVALANGKLCLLESSRGRGVTLTTWHEAVQGQFELWGWP